MPCGSFCAEPRPPRRFFWWRWPYFWRCGWCGCGWYRAPVAAAARLMVCVCCVMNSILFARVHHCN